MFRCDFQPRPGSGGGCRLQNAGTTGDKFCHLGDLLRPWAKRLSRPEQPRRCQLRPVRGGGRYRGGGRGERSVQTQFFQPVAQGTEAQPQQFGSSGLVLAGLLQGIEDGLFLHLAEVIFQRHTAGQGRGRST